MNEKETFIRSFREIQPKFSRFYAHLLMNARLSLPQYALLNLLAGQKSMTMTEASGKLHITKPAVTHLADRLEKNKFLKRRAHSQDRRISLLEIQPKGEKKAREVQAQALQFLLKTFDQFNAPERETITRFYNLLSQTMDQVLGKK